MTLTLPGPFIRKTKVMRIKLLTPIIVILLFSFFALADDQPVRIRTSELERTPLTAGALKIRLTQFRGSVLKIGYGSVEAQVENTSTGFTTFSPQRLSFIGSDNNQADVLAIGTGDRYFPAMDRRIAPGAHIREIYTLNGKVRLPARCYYDEKLLAVITD